MKHCWQVSSHAPHSRKLGHKPAVAPHRATIKPLQVLSHKQSQRPNQLEHVATAVEDLFKHVGMGLAGAVCAASLLLAPPAVAEQRLIRLPASSDPAIFAAQRTLLEAWGIVGDSFYDTDFNHHNWGDELKARMVAAYQASAPEVAMSQVEDMLKDLGDPFTRRLPPGEYTDFRATSDGGFQGVGLLLTARVPEETDSNLLRVIEPIKGGPAYRAGVLPGDELVSVNGESAVGWTAEQAAKVLRGDSGSEVRVQLARRTTQIPGVPGRPEPRTPEVELQEVRLKRERVTMSPLYATMLQDTAAHHVGYLRLTNFSSNAAEEMRHAIEDFEAKGANEYILDLRSNPGGLVDASIDIAGLWIEGQPTVFTVTGRPYEPMMRVSVDHPGHALTTAPLVVLVNKESASASEILSGALRDHHRATIVGDQATYGKGKIQSVFEMQDGGALLVTVARYKTPAGTEIDHKGIKPDRSCAVPLLAKLIPSTRGDDNFQPGLPAGPGGEEALTAKLATDRCVMTAERLLAHEHPVHGLIASSRAPANGQQGAIKAHSVAVRPAAP